MKVRGNNRPGDVIVFPDSRDVVSTNRTSEPEIDLDRGSSRAQPVSRVLLLGDVLFHREALAGALRTYDDVELIGSVADVNAALILTEEKKPDVLIVDSPSDEVARALAAPPLACKFVFIGSVSERCRQLGSRRDAIFVGATSSLDELHVALRFSRTRQAARRTPPGAFATHGDGPDSILTLREREVSQLVAGGYSNKEIAGACGISIATVKNHVHRILAKMNFQRRAQIARHAGDRHRR